MARRRTRRALTQWPTHSGSTLASTHGSQRPPHLLGRRESAGCGRVIGRPHLLSTRGGRMRISSQAGRVSCATRRSLGRARAGTKPGLRTRPPCTPPCMRARTSMQRDVSGTLYSIKGSACPLDLVLLLLVFVVYTARVLAKSPYTHMYMCTSLVASFASVIHSPTRVTSRREDSEAPETATEFYTLLSHVGLQFPALHKTLQG